MIVTMTLEQTWRL